MAAELGLLHLLCKLLRISSKIGFDRLQNETRAARKITQDRVRQLSSARLIMKVTKELIEKSLLPKVLLTDRFVKKTGVAAGLPPAHAIVSEDFNNKSIIDTLVVIQKFHDAVLWEFVNDTEALAKTCEGMTIPVPDPVKQSILDPVNKDLVQKLLHNTHYML